jgi:formylglycine-generating enzyme required for sulfatase activity
MGDTFGEGDNDEKPVHKVCLDDYYLGKYEVTQGQWQRIMGNNPARFKNGDNYPVEQVCWNDVQKFIKQLNSQTDGKYRLPTEAEWEFACREGGKKIRFGNGKDIIDPNEANFNGSSRFKKSYSKSGAYR